MGIFLFRGKEGEKGWIATFGQRGQLASEALQRTLRGSCMGDKKQEKKIKK
jgi:hypothetical protein